MKVKGRAHPWWTLPETTKAVDGLDLNLTRCVPVITTGVSNEVPDSVALERGAVGTLARSLHPPVDSLGLVLSWPVAGVAI